MILAVRENIVTGGMEQEQEATEATSPASTQRQGKQTEKQDKRP